MVTVYTMANCQPCRMTKRQMDQLGISYEEVSLNEHPEELETIRARGFMSAPVVLTDNDSWSGYSPSKIKGIAQNSMVATA